MLYRELEEETKLNWQKNLEESSKAALTKQFFPSISDTQIEDRRNPKLHCTSDRTRENQSLPTPVPTTGQCNMSLQEGRTDYGPLDIPLHLASTSKGNTQEGNTKSWKLAIIKHDLITKYLK